MKGRRSPASAMMGLGSGLRTMSRGRSRWTKSQQLVVVAFFFICCVIGWLHDLGGTVTSLEEAPLHCSDPVLAAEPMFEGKQKAHNDPEHWLTAAARAKDLQAAVKPGTYVKLFLMIRHGEGTHNEAKARVGKEEWYKNEGKNTRYLDAALTNNGHLQTARLAKDLSYAQTHGLQIDRLVVSPMSRALETAADVFPFHYTSVLWPATALEGLREAAGLYPCDKRSSRRELMKRFPAVDFSLLPADKDPLWKKDGREPKEKQAVRVKEALIDLVQLYGSTDEVIAVVGHSGWISTAIKLLTGNVYNPRNCELVAVTVQFECSPNPRAKHRSMLPGIA